MVKTFNKSDAFIVQWSNTEMFSIPKIEESWNGWTYRPDQARTAAEIKRGRNKSFGMGRDGSKAARVWFEDYIRNDIRNHKGQVPQALIPKPEPYSNGHGYRPSISISVDHPIFGEITLGAAQQNASAAQYWVRANRYVVMLAEVEGVNFTLGSMSASTMLSTGVSIGSLTLEQFFAGWLKDPVGQSVAKIKHPGLQRLFELYEMPEIHDLPEPERNGVQEGFDRFVFRADQDAHLLFGKGRELAIKGGSPALGELVNALNQTGAKVRLSKQYDYYSSDYAVTGISIRVEASEEHDNRHGHEIVITTDGVKVVCGYVKDEKAWIEYQRRHAADLLSSLGQSTVARETTEYKIKE